MEENGSSSSRVSGSSQGKKLTLKSVKSEKMLLTTDSDSIYGSKSRISIGGISKGKSRKTTIQEDSMTYGKISTQ